MLAALAVPLSCGKDAPPTDTPATAPEHVLMLVVDTLRADHLSAWGHERETSPTLDALAESGVRFARAVSQCSWTAPSMVSLMTGRYLADDRLDIPEDVTTLAELFQGAGYGTAAFISNPLLSEPAGFHRGFDRAQHIPPYEPDDPIVEWLESRSGERTFTYVHLNEPHDPYESPEGTRVWMPDPPALDAERIELYETLTPELVNEEELAYIRRSIAGYDDDILYTDRRIELMLDALRRTDQLERTAIVVTADHGEGLWTRLDFANNGPRAKRVVDGEPPSLSTHFKMTHGNQVHTELVHIPLILVAPGIDGGQVVEDWVENVDVVPTLLELCDIPDPGALQGESLLRSLEDPRRWKKRKPHVYTATRFVCSVITQDGWQLMVPTALGECQEGLVVQLFDLNSDPEARVNVAEAHPERVEELAGIVLERRSSGMPGHFGLDPMTTINLEELGYAGNGIVDELQIEYAELETDQLFSVLENLKRTCVERMYAARTIADRRKRGELEDAELGRLETLLEKELARGVLQAFGR